MTKDQAVDFLEILQYYSRWMHYSEDSKTKFEQNLVTCLEYPFRLNINDQGFYEVYVPKLDLTGVYATSIVNAPPRGLENLAYIFLIVNKDKLPEKYHKFFGEVGMFVNSAFQRSAAFCFLSRMAPETIEGIARDLALAGPKPSLN